jgi:hypothetical protein
MAPSFIDFHTGFSIAPSPITLILMKPTTLAIVVLILVILAGAGWFAYISMRPASPAPVVASFADCVAAGYPVLETSPRQCKTPDGRTYAEEPTPAQVAASITYKNASANDVVVTNPTPGAVTGKEVMVMGKARGPWYFEASFPVQILDANGKVLASGPAKAEGDWMTTEFVPFKITLTVPTSYIGPATLVLHKDNPSGLPEKEASVSFPFTIEY